MLTLTTMGSLPVAAAAAGPMPALATTGLQLAGFWPLGSVLQGCFTNPHANTEVSIFDDTMPIRLRDILYFKTVLGTLNNLLIKCSLEGPP